jgi:hypothetical protein
MKLTFVGQRPYVFTYGASVMVSADLEYGTEPVTIRLLRNIFLRYQYTGVRLVWDEEVSR